MVKCQECGSTENVRRVYNMEKKTEIGLQCWECRKERVWNRVRGTGTLKGDEQDGKEGDGPSGQTGLGDFV